MFEALVIFQIIIVLIFVGVFLLQKSSFEGLANLAGGSTMTSKKISGFLHKLAILVGVTFILNSLILAKLQYKKYKKSEELIQKIESIPPIIDLKDSSTSQIEEIKKTPKD